MASIPVYVSKIWWDKVPGDLRALMLAESREIEGELIAWNNAANARTIASWKKNGGTVNFVGANYKKLFPGMRMTKKEFTYQLSDHLPLWIEVDVDLERERLDQMLNR